MTITIQAAATSRDLTTLANLKEELGLEPSDLEEESRLGKLITRTSVEIESFTQRAFAKEEVSETLPGTDRLRLSLSRVPVISVTSVTLDGSAFAAANYSLEDRAAGFLFNNKTWASKLVLASGTIARTRSPQRGEHIWAVRYHGGYYLPSFSNLTAAITGATQADPVVITASSHSRATGDQVRITGIVGMTELNGQDFVITVINANSYSLDGEDGTSHTAYGSAGTWTVTPQLPGDLEQITIDLIRARRAMQSRDPTVKQERLGDWSATYEVGASGLPVGIEKRLMPYMSFV